MLRNVYIIAAYAVTMVTTDSERLDRRRSDNNFTCMILKQDTANIRAGLISNVTAD